MLERSVTVLRVIITTYYQIDLNFVNIVVPKLKNCIAEPVAEIMKPLLKFGHYEKLRKA